jgi:hypothetical protein
MARRVLKSYPGYYNRVRGSIIPCPCSVDYITTTLEFNSRTMRTNNSQKEAKKGYTVKKLAMLSTNVAMLLLIWLVARFGVAIAAGDPHSVRVSVAYADNDHHSCRTIPRPWAGSRGVMFIGTGSPWDSGAIKLENPSNQRLTVDRVTVDVDGATGIPVPGYSPFIIPPRGTAILTQRTSFNFDVSDGCSSTGGPWRTCSSASGSYTPGSCTRPSSAIPVVHVTVGAVNPVTKNFIDEDQVLNDHGVDGNACPRLFPRGCEGLSWDIVQPQHSTFPRQFHGFLPQR